MAEQRRGVNGEQSVSSGNVPNKWASWHGLVAARHRISLWSARACQRLRLFSSAIIAAPDAKAYATKQPRCAGKPNGPMARRGGSCEREP